MVQRLGREIVSYTPATLALLEMCWLQPVSAQVNKCAAGLLHLASYDYVLMNATSSLLFENISCVRLAHFAPNCLHFCFLPSLSDAAAGAGGVRRAVQYVLGAGLPSEKCSD